MLYIFDKDDNFKNIITEDTGLIDTWFKDYQNHLIDEPFVFHVDSESELLPLIVAENQVAFKHTIHAMQQGVESFKLMRIKEVEELYSADGYIVSVSCEPSWLELYDHFIEDKRISNGTAQTAMNRALEGSRWGRSVPSDLGYSSTNFYWIDAVEALFKIAEEWGGTLQDYITLNDKNEITTRIMFMFPRLGRDNGLLIQPDYNAETIERRTLSYPITAMYGQGASLETESGGHTRYITFEDVEWKVSNGDPVDKPLGQKWVGDPQALAKYGYLKDGSRMHRFGHFSNQDYETPEELLYATWQALQENKEPEIYHEATIHEVDKPIYLGDTGTILDRHYGKPIEVQSQITGLEYDILKPTENVNIVLGNYKDMSIDPLEEEIDRIKENQKKPVIIDGSNFPNKIPSKPINVQAIGGWETIQLTWTYTDEVYVSHYEVYASQTQGFVPDTQFLVYSGKVSAFGHEVKTDEVWYYRVCAVNYHGVKSEFSDEATASTIRIPLDATNFESIVTDAKNTADEAYDNANIAAQNAMDAISQAQLGFDKAIESLDQSGLALEQADESFQKALENADEIESLALRIVSTNMITHDSDNWVQGNYYSNGTTNNTGSLLYIRSNAYLPIKGNVQYTLTSYGDYEVFINFYSDKSRFEGVGQQYSTTDSISFIAPQNAEYFDVYVKMNDGSEILTSEIADKIKVKLEKGDVSSDWTMYDPDYTNIVATQKGIQTEIGNVQGDITTITAIAQGLDFRVTDNENNIANLQITSQGISGQLQSVNTRLDELDSDDRNLITHLPANWESGYINNSTGDNVSASTTIRTIDYYDIKPNEEYILQTYGNYEIILVQFDSSKNALGQSNAIYAGKSYGDVVFTTHNNARYYRAYFRRLNDPHEQLDNGMVGSVLKAKLHKGNEPVEWTPNIMDTGELVNQVQHFVHDFNVTAEGLSSRIEDNTGNINQLANTVDGTQQTISNMQGDINTVTNLANVNQQQLGNLDGDVNTLTQTVNATISRIENTSGNMITHDANNWEQGYVGTSSGNNLTSPIRIRAKEYYKIDRNQEYTLTSYGNYSVTLTLFNESSSTPITSYTTSANGSITFTTPSTARRFRVHVTEADNSSINPNMIGVNIKVQLEKGEYANDWKDHAGDTYSQYSQLQDAINLRVKEGDLLSQINIEADRILIDTTGKLVLNAQSTLISNAVIKNAHIESLSGQKIISKSIIADKLNVASLDAITADLGTVTSGLLKSQNNNMELNLNTGTLNMQNADFTLGGGANIEFTSSGNKILYKLLGPNSFYRSSGMGIGRVAGNDLPFAYVGTTPGGDLDTLSSGFSGLMTHTTYHINNNGAANSISGNRFALRDAANGWVKGMTFDWSGNNPEINVYSPTNYDYTLGTFYKILGKQSFNIQNYFNGRSGWILETNYADDGSDITLRGQYGADYNYQIGQASSIHRIRNIYLTNAPNVSSDERLKEDIQDLELGLDFINRINPIRYSLKATNADKLQGTVKNVTQYGISAQQVLSVLGHYGITDQSLITGTDEEMYGASYEQFIAPMINAIKELTNITETQQTIIDDLLLKVANLEGIA